MKLLKALSKHLLSLPGVNRDNTESFVDLGKLKLTGKDLGHGIELGRFQYDAVISIERFPSELAPLLLAVILTWLAEHDPDRYHMGLEDPDIDVSLDDEQTVSVQISVEFDEPLYLVRDDEGPITHDGQTWRVDDVLIDTAEVLNKLDKKTDE